jgi:hypothetical protein
MKLEFYAFGVIIFLESFVLCKTFVELFFRILKFECIFCYPLTMFSNLLWALIYFVKQFTCVDLFK